MMLLLSECVTDGRGIIIAIVEHVSRVTHVKPKTVYMGTLITQRQRQWHGFCQSGMAFAKDDIIAAGRSKDKDVYAL